MWMASSKTISNVWEFFPLNDKTNLKKKSRVILNKKVGKIPPAPPPSSIAISKSMKSNKSKNTKPEILLRKALWSSGLRGYRLNWKNIDGSPDIAFPGRKIAVFVHGCFWHSCPHCDKPLPKKNRGFWRAKFTRNKERDQITAKALKEKDWRVVIAWECQIKNNLSDVLNLITKCHVKAK